MWIKYYIRIHLQATYTRFIAEKDIFGHYRTHQRICSLSEADEQEAHIQSNTDIYCKLCTCIEGTCFRRDDQPGVGLVEWNKIKQRCLFE